MSDTGAGRGDPRSPCRHVPHPEWETDEDSKSHYSANTTYQSRGHAYNYSSNIPEISYPGSGRGHPERTYSNQPDAEQKTVSRADEASYFYYPDDGSYQHQGYNRNHSSDILRGWIYPDESTKDKLIQLIQELGTLTSRYLREIDVLNDGNAYWKRSVQYMTCERDFDKIESQGANARFEGAVLSGRRNEERIRNEIAETKWKCMLDEKDDHIDKLKKKMMTIESDYETMEEKKKSLEKSLGVKNKELAEVKKDNFRYNAKIVDLENEMVNNNKKVELKRIEEIIRNIMGTKELIEDTTNNHKTAMEEKNLQIETIFQDLIKVREECSNEIENVKSTMNEKAERCRNWYEQAMMNKNQKASYFIDLMYNEFKDVADQHNERLNDARKRERATMEKYVTYLLLNSPDAHENEKNTSSCVQTEGVLD